MLWPQNAHWAKWQTIKNRLCFLPPPQFFTDDHYSSPALTVDVDEPWLLYQDPAAPSIGTPTSTDMLCPLTQESRESESPRTAREDARYDALPETTQIDVADGYVTFCCKFKYLGSRISYSLPNDDNIEARLAAANQIMGPLKEVWRNPHLDTYSKYHLFHAIPVNLLLWGCENWLLRPALLRKLEVFLHCRIQQILHISITAVKEHHIRNKRVHQMFYDIPCIKNMIAARQLGFLGKVI